MTPSKKIKVLVVDDETDLTDLIKIVLEGADYEIYVAEDGAACLKKANALKPDLILLDVMLPGKSGYHILQELRQLGPEVKNIPVILMSAGKNVKDLFRAWEFEGFLHKPFTADQLKEVVDKTLKFHLKYHASGPESNAPAEVFPDPAPSLTSQPARVEAPILIVAPDCVEIKVLSASLRSLGFTTELVYEEEAAVNVALSSAPVLILAEPTTDPQGVDVLRLYQRLKKGVETQGTPFAVFIQQSSPLAQPLSEEVLNAIIYRDTGELLYGVKKLLRDLDLIKAKAA